MKDRASGAAVRWSESARGTLDSLDGKLFVTIPRAAPLFDADERTIRRAIVAGEIPAVKVGVTWRIPVAWIREQARLGLDGSAGAA